MNGPTIGSLCSGYGGLELGLMAAVRGRVVWHAEYEAGPSKILAAHWPDVPNLGDITTTDWADVPKVDWLTAGFPCQPFSQAGKRKGAADERHLWPFVADAVRLVRPRWVLFENVAGHVSLGLDRVLADLAALGYVGGWGVLRAADAGAAHGRARLFIVASDSGGERHGRGEDGRSVGRVDGADAGGSCERERSREVTEHRRGAAASDADSERGNGSGLHRPGERRRSEPADRGVSTTDAEGFAGSLIDGNGSALADANGAGSQGSEPAAGHNLPPRSTATDAEGDRRDERWPEPARIFRGPDALPDSDGWGFQVGPELYGDAAQDTPHWRSCGVDANVCSSADWGQYEHAIRRWERTIGRSASSPTEAGRNGPRLSPRFVEWLMGLPAGWVTDVPGLTRSAQLKALGNGVVPQQAALAVRTLLPLLLSDLEDAA